MSITNSKKESIGKEKNKAIILDRDGVLIHDIGYVHKVEDFRFIPKAVDALKLLSQKGFKLIIITNQSGIGRGYYTKEDFLKFNNHLINELSKNKIKIEKTYYCPHHPDESCNCRKPSTRHAEEAKKEFDIDLKRSYVIGDHPSDIEMGKKAGCKAAYVLTGHGKKHKGQAKAADFIAEDLYDAAKWIVSRERKD